VPFGEYWASPAPTLFEEPSGPFLSLPASGERIGVRNHNKLPYAIHYNLMVQRQLSGSIVLSLGYVGTLGRHMLSMVEANPGDSAVSELAGIRGDAGDARMRQVSPRPDVHPAGWHRGLHDA
jgi:hypothetical protein